LLYPNYDIPDPQLTLFCPQLKQVLDEVRLKSKKLFPLHLLFHKFIYMDIDYTHDLLETLLE
jgi:hypothetical protein